MAHSVKLTVVCGWGLWLGCAEPPPKPTERPVLAEPVVASEPAVEPEEAPTPEFKPYPRPPAKSADAKIVVDGHEIELTVEADECVVTRTGGGPKSRVATGLKPPCYWSRWATKVSSGVTEMGTRHGLEKGDVQAFRINDQAERMILVLVGDPIDDPNWMDDEVAVRWAEAGMYCGGDDRLIFVTAAGLQLSPSTGNPINCVELPPENAALWVRTHPKE